MTAADYQAEGRKFIQEEKFADAIRALSQAVKLDPYLATAFNAPVQAALPAVAS